jgi:hypothetical protein
MNLTIAQESSPLTSNQWAWSVMLDGPEELLDQVVHVTYHLHETFPKPIHTIRDRERRFRLDARGWGEFMIYVEVHFEDGEVRKFEHWLTLSSGRAAAPSDTPVSDPDPDPATGSEPGGDSGREPDPGAPFTIFVSSNLADSDIAETMRDALRRQGARVLCATDIPGGETMASSMGNLLEKADLGVAVVSDRTGSHVHAEVSEILRRRRPVIPLLRETEGASIIPTELQGRKAIPLKAGFDADDVARKVMGVARGMRHER